MTYYERILGAESSGMKLLLLEIMAHLSPELPSLFSWSG
ncbi:hypothetical protein MTMN5_04031 (plasmid) [Marinobacter salarius]|nr:hypothetical protein MTMN5_04031 [Marinobacter salarius]|eukprot:CAMPEP_0197475372 /NCGR_PEP_ID=MMETSP1309-20131121/6823_1 /TAXON_ID=464262 /ORGANISM="Genus nov. species nov., Strain RCC998" /LENGTH=38 /DNA_ID= /DNA_START= /DNA_END= /DNA_ORIENTATION=